MNNVGGLFQNLTKPSLVDASGTPTYYNSADDALAAGSAKINAAPRPTVTVTPPTGATLTPTDDPSQPPQMTTQGGGVTYSAPSASLPIFRKQPTFQAASTDPATGLPAQNAPALTKGGRLLQVLTLAAKGAMAGQAASEQAVIQSGGHRSGGAGIGFEAGLTEPAREAMQHAEVQRSGLQNQTEQMALDQARTPVSVGGATMPFWLAQRNLALQKTQADINKDGIVTPRNGGVYDTATGQYAPGTEPQDKKQNQNPQQVLADAIADAQHRGVDPNSDPKVKQIQDVIAAGNNKPDTGTELKQKQAGIIAKLQAANELPDGALTDLNKMSRAINSSKTLTRQEKQDAIGYFATNTTPASTGATITLRNEGYKGSRFYNVLDTKNGNQPIMVSADELGRASAEEPGRYLSQAGGTQALGKTALMEDIRGNVQQVRQSLQNMPDFDNSMKGRVAMALRDKDPHSAVSTLINSEAARELTSQQQDYLINVSQLIENAMAMRSVLGAGQGANDLRDAIRATIPGASTPTREYGLKQLDAFEKVLDRLERGVPNVPLRPQGKGGAGATGANKHSDVGFVPLPTH